MDDGRSMRAGKSSLGRSLKIEVGDQKALVRLQSAGRTLSSLKGVVLRGSA